MTRKRRVRVSEHGGLVIPASLRKALGIKVGDEVVLWTENNEIRMTAFKGQLERAQRLVRKHVKRGQSLADELIAERRASVHKD